MLFAPFFVLTPKGIPSRRRCGLLTATALFSLFAGYFYGLSDDAILPLPLASAVALLPSAILCIRFLVIPYGGWIPYLTSTIVLILGTPVLCAFYEVDFGLMLGLALSFPAVVLSELPKPTARETSPAPDGPAAPPGETALPTREGDRPNPQLRRNVAP